MREDRRGGDGQGKEVVAYEREMFKEFTAGGHIGDGEAGNRTPRIVAWQSNTARI